MAVPNINIPSYIIAYWLWGDLLGNASSIANLSMNALGSTINGTVPHSTAEFKGLSASLSRSPTSLSWTAIGVKTVTITANCAWTASISGTGGFFISNQFGKISLSSTVHGGNGSIDVTQVTSGSRTGTLIITAANSTGGGRTTYTVSLSSNI